MSNSWSQFMRLLPKVDSIVGQILSMDSDAGVAVLASIGSGDFVAKMVKGGADYAVDDWVLVKDGIITSVIPVPKGENTAGVPKDIMIS